MFNWKIKKSWGKKRSICHFTSFPVEIGCSLFSSFLWTYLYTTDTYQSIFEEECYQTTDWPCALLFSCSFVSQRVSERIDFPVCFIDIDCAHINFLRGFLFLSIILCDHMGVYTSEAWCSLISHCHQLMIIFLKHRRIICHFISNYTDKIFLFFIAAFDNTTFLLI